MDFFKKCQTGSGKTYTMMGEVHEMDNSLCEDRGITPRIFEYLFMQIREVRNSKVDTSTYSLLLLLSNTSNC